ncbi:single-stranded DNA-binding protein [soil metagenome]
MSDVITLTGLVATEPRHIVTAEGLSITTFRLASNQRRFDRSQERWVDGETNWYTISSFRQLAINSSTSIKKGERVLVTGRVRLRDWQNSEKAGTNVDIEADAIGHDLGWGASVFTRSITSTSSTPQADEAPTSVATSEQEGEQHPQPIETAEPMAPSPVDSTVPF